MLNRRFLPLVLLIGIAIGLSSTITQARANAAPSPSSPKTSAPSSRLPKAPPSSKVGPNEFMQITVPAPQLPASSPKLLPNSLAAVKGTSSPQASFGGWYEDFESWTTNNTWEFSDNAHGGDYLWGQRKCYVFSGVYAGFTAGGGNKGQSRSCTSSYPASAREWATLGYFDLRDYTEGLVTFTFKGKTEYVSGSLCNTNDYFFIGAGVPDSNNNINFRGWSLCGDYSDTYYQRTFDLSTFNVLGKNFVYFGLLFVSDSDNNRFNGVALDDLLMLWSKPDQLFIPMAGKTTPPPSIQNCPDTEPNNFAKDAKAITIFDANCRGQFSNDTETPPDDWYAITVPAGKTISVELSGIPANADYDMYLFDEAFLSDPNRPFVAQSAKQGNSNESIIYNKNTKLQRYFIRVYGYQQAAPNTYLLRVTLS